MIDTPRAYRKPTCDCPPDAHRHPRVEFKVDGETLVIHTDHLKVSEIIELVDEDPADHYLVEIKPKDVTYRDIDVTIEIPDHAEYVTIFTKETPVS